MKRNCIEFEILIGLIAVIAVVVVQVVLIVLDFGVVDSAYDSMLRFH
jgi:hypothetical protein